MDLDSEIGFEPVRSTVSYIELLTRLNYTLVDGQWSSNVFAFRGQEDDSWELESSAERRLKKSPLASEESINELFIRYHEDIILAGRRSRFDWRGSGGQLHDLELLADLQHHRAATCLIDFTRSALVALWFACENTSKDGKVFVVNLASGSQFLQISPSDIENKTISEILNFETRRTDDGHSRDSSPEEVKEPDEYRPKFWHWSPASLNERIPAQHSLFVFAPLSSGKLKAVEISVESTSKEQIREELKDIHDIHEESLFPDFTGFAYRQRHDASYGPSAANYYRLGVNAEQSGEYLEAVKYLSSSIQLNPNSFRAYRFRSDAYMRLEKFDLAIGDQSKMLELIPEADWVYRHRGSAYERQGKFDKAISDYSKYLEATNYGSSVAFGYRAAALAGFGDFEGAVEDYTQAIALEADFEGYYARRGVVQLCLRKWDQAKLDLVAAQELGMDVPEFFSAVHGSLDDFERMMSLQVPREIASLLTK